MLAHERPGVETHFEDHGGELGIVPHLRIADVAYDELVDELIIKVHESGQIPNQIIAIMFGGATPARAIAELFNIEMLAYYALKRYFPSDPSDQRKMKPDENVILARDLLKAHHDFGADVLAVDDLTDEGVTFKRFEDWLTNRSRFGQDVRSLRTACLWKKVHSEYPPTFWVDEVVPIQLPDSTVMKMPWIDQPMERKYSMCTIEDVLARTRAVR
ncbi:MAG: phosphoribosyltransferase family protein [Candidatus Uhrbacteria bacterium]